MLPKCKIMNKNFIMDKKFQGKTKMPEEKCRRQDQITKKQTGVDSMGEVWTLIALLSDPVFKETWFLCGTA